MRSGTTKPISAEGTKFLGRYIADTNKSTFTSASSSLLSKFNASLQALDSRPIRGEYKPWIYQNYLAPSFHYHLAVNPSTTKVIKNLEASSTRLIKKWLNLPKSATQAILYHPDVLNIPQVNTIRLKAKISYLSAILNSPDLLIRELRVLLNNPNNNNYVKQQWDKHLSSLEVQGKFSEIASLESVNKTWKKIMLHGLPYGQLSFILKAGSDTLPHPLNLRRWKIQCDSKCPLCHSLRPTTAHILIGCPTSLDQGRYTWRHDSALKKFLQGITPLLRSDSKLYADIDQWRAEDTIPPNIVSTSS